MVFFINDLYAFYNWKHLEKSQIMRKDWIILVKTKKSRFHIAW
jgi:hypothetical protein